ncbi:MAG: divalent-cation tolerance protein CutA [Candidatus Omnitrophica bacterium]|nr:divalent-cation tolerance protein CutA [Candidatus Omnitrophota bacterium]
MGHIVVFVTASKEEEAEIIARALLEKKLAACCNLVSGVKSLYWWQGKITDDQEVLLVIKTRTDMFDKIKETVIAYHSYAVPEIIALPVVAGSEPYLKWIDQSLIV